LFDSETQCIGPDGPAGRILPAGLWFETTRSFFRDIVEEKLGGLGQGEYYPWLSRTVGLDQCFSNFFIPSPPFHSPNVVFAPQAC